MPVAAWPAHEEHAIVAEYAVTGTRPIELPLSRDDLTIFSCDVEPAAVRAHFTADRRVLEPPPGCERVLVRCRYRAYATGDGPPPPPAVLFPGATIRVGP